MSILRNQLESAKAEYHAAKYPGDLAAELMSLQMPQPQLKPTVNRWWWAGAGGSAVAAALVAAFFLNTAPHASVNPERHDIPLIFGNNGSVGGIRLEQNNSAGGDGSRLVDAPATRPSDTNTHSHERHLDYTPQPK